MSVCDDMQKIPLPRYLQEHGHEILNILNNTSGWDYDVDAWRREFRDNREVSNDLSIIMKICPKRIGRSDVHNLAKEAHLGSYSELRRFFLACMIWGYGPDGNGPQNTRLSLTGYAARKVLINTANRIKKGQIKEAYEEFDLAGCGPAFFTKFFYFVGLEWQVKPLPLILDRHIANFLRFLGTEEGWAFSLFAEKDSGGYIKRYSKGYVQYICAMNDWANELDCSSADNIEYFMYKKDKELEKALGEVDAEGNPKVPIIYRRDGVYCLKCDAFLASPEPAIGFTLDKIKGIVWRHGCYDC